METLLIVLPILILSVVVHEYAHGWVARSQGDNTAAMLGRLTLNPIPHIDPIGSVLIPGILALTGSPILGWAKPVPVNPRNFREFKRGDILVSLAGVASNLLLAVLFAIGVVLVTWLAQLAPDFGAIWQTLFQMARLGIRINLILLFFNLIPVPPLDGSHVFYYLLPPRLAVRYRALGQYGMLVLFGLLWLGAFTFLLVPVFWVENLMLAAVNVLVA